MAKREIHFSFENLEVWQKAITFADTVIDIIDKLETDRKHYRLIEELESSVTSIAMNIAEGKGRFSKKEFAKFLYIARGSLFESVALMEIFKRRRWVAEDQYDKFYNDGNIIGKMLTGLINSIKSS